MHPKHLIFLKEVEPVILNLASKWFPPDQRTPDNKYFYSCTHCDQNCGKHDIHDPYCLYELAKATKEEWDKVDSETKKYKKNYVNKPRSKKEMSEIKKNLKYRAFFKYFFKFPMRLVAWDYSTAGKDWQNVVCGCFMLQKGVKKLKHHLDCPEMKISKAISKLYNCV